jgi:predicted O-methyltransferase YrrM
MFTGFYDVSKRPLSPIGECKQPPFNDPEAPVNPDQRQWEFSQLLGIYRRLAPRCVLEIGSYCGGSLYQWMKHARPGARIIAIDLVGGPWGDSWTQNFVGQWRNWVPQGVEFHHLPVSSHEPATKTRLLQITDHVDFILIDGDHRYEGARCDFEMYGPLVRPGGVIAFHDILPNPTRPTISVSRLWQEIREAGFITQELYSSREQGGYGIGVVYIV